MTQRRLTTRTRPTAKRASAPPNEALQLTNALLIELEARWPNAVEAVREEAGYDDDAWDEYYAALDRDQGPTAYVFRCRHCGRLGAYSDMHRVGHRLQPNVRCR
jgi:hypothetical protein